MELEITTFKTIVIRYNWLFFYHLVDLLILMNATVRLYIDKYCIYPYDFYQILLTVLSRWRVYYFCPIRGCERLIKIKHQATSALKRGVGGNRIKFWRITVSTYKCITSKSGKDSVKLPGKSWKIFRKPRTKNIGYPFGVLRNFQHSCEFISTFKINDLWRFVF